MALSRCSKTALISGSPALLVKRDWFREEPPTKSLENERDTPRGRFQITKSAREPNCGKSRWKRARSPTFGPALAAQITRTTAKHGF